MVDNTLLQSPYAADARDVWLDGGTLLGLPTAREVYECTSLLKTGVYRLPQSYDTPAYIFGSTWMEFEDPETDVLRSAVPGDTHDRYYWVSPSTVPSYNTRARIDGGDAPWKLGVTTPPTAPGVTPSGGSGSNVTRAYVATWVTAYGEESAPSPATLATNKVDATWAITVPARAAADDGGVGDDRNITLVRIYRTVTDTAGVATFFLVVEQSAATLSYNDTKTDAQITSNNQLQSTGWTPPPSDLEGWVLLPSGALAAWRENEVWFSEPYRFHAWPATYVQTTEYDIVGLGVVGQTLVVCTKGYPITFSGASPANMSPSKMANYEPCTSRRSVVSAPEGVYYASPNGLVLVAGGVAQNITSKVMAKSDWNTLTDYSKIIAARFGTSYYAYSIASRPVFQEDAFEPDLIQLAAEETQGILLDPTTSDGSVIRLTSPTPLESLFTDPWSGEVLFVREGKVYWLDVAYGVEEYKPYLWRSKKFELPKAANLGALKVYFKIPPGTPELSGEPNADLVQELADDQYGLVRVYADDRHIFTRELRSSGELMKLPGGFKATYWQFEFEARVEIRNLQFASTAKELQGEPADSIGRVS